METFYEPEKREVGEGGREGAHEQILGEVEGGEIPADGDGGGGEGGVEVVVGEREVRERREGAEGDGRGSAGGEYRSERKGAAALESAEGDGRGGTRRWSPEGARQTGRAWRRGDGEGVGEA
ncbi:glycine-rich cell wall structural protein 1.0-like [Salvia miltiorrhiza]|uniref:glycine-rich cell wall structural protein 1.0-like n=1 Tax=Salvia miltiorrhiza TaxID=226208 RepID=UPI0025AB5E83|nr:glycine-rich cell wall structural protein 1.0-like [Salvia miltiorrhiza]